MTLLAARFDKKCGKSGIPDRAKCTKKTTARAAPGPELKERAFALSTGIQAARAGTALIAGNKAAALRRLRSAAKNASEYAQERGERTGNKKLLAFATGKNIAESVTAARGAARSLKAGNVRGFAANLAEAANTGLESYTFNRQRQGKQLAGWEEANRNFGDLLQANKWYRALNNSGITAGNIKKGRPFSGRTNSIRRKPARKPTGWRAPSRSLLDDENGSLWAAGFKVDAGPNLSVGRGEKQSVEKGGGLTAKGRAKYNRQTGSNLKAPVTGKVKPGSKAAKRRKSFCARSKSWTGERGKAARRRWKC